MATKQSEQDKVAANTRDNNRRSDSDKPFANSSTNPEEVRVASKDRVGKPVNSSFDERTGVQQPWLKEDGSQDNGAPDLDEQPGASRSSTREGDKTTVEETEKAIDEGIVEGPQRLDETKDAKPKNPVK